MTIKAIETHHNGYRFRSRAEARWSIFFDTLGLRWEYEPEGFDLGADGWYLPDFLLPDVDGGTWVEVKPDSDLDVRTKVNGRLDLYDEDLEGGAKLRGLCRMTGMAGLLALGPPELVRYPYLYSEGKTHWLMAGFIQKFLPSLSGSLPYDDAPDCVAAVHAARSARFEHGMSG